MDAEFGETLRRCEPNLVSRRDESGGWLAQDTFEDLLSRFKATVCLHRVQTVHFVLAIRDLRPHPTATWPKVFVAMQQNVGVFSSDSVQEWTIAFR
jgi:hypothetical protein